MNRLECADAARAWLATEPLFLDTETTGLGPEDEICQIAIVDHRGNVVLESLVKPSVPIGVEAQRVHGITDEMVKGALTFCQVWPLVGELLAKRDVVIYNADFDLRMLRQSGRNCPAFPMPFVKPNAAITLNFDGRGRMIAVTDLQSAEPILPEQRYVHDAMLLYAEFYGDINPRYGTARWQKLGDAAAQCGIAVDGALHGARVDAETTRRIVLHMAEYREAAEGDTMGETATEEPDAQKDKASEASA